MNFFDPDCQEPPRTDALFGIRDERKGLAAYTTTTDPKQWDATVKNPQQLSLTFTAVDKCVIKDHEEKARGRCDGILTSAKHLYFIEIEHGQKDWIKDATEQLESTIQFFQAHHDLSAFQHKKAFACNRRHSNFQEIDQDINFHFFRTYKVRLDIQAEVIVV